jgi:hypothetical protein
MVPELDRPGTGCDWAWEEAKPDAKASQRFGAPSEHTVRTNLTIIV